MVSEIATGLITGGASLLGSIFGGLFGHKSNKDTNQANMELAKYKYEKDLEMWNRQNEYNTPSAQMERYAQAGLNPNLVYDQGNNGNASAPPSFDVPDMKAYTDYGDFGFGRAAGDILQGYQLANQREQIESQKEVNDATISEKYANALKTQQDRLFTMEKTFEQRKKNGYLDEQLGLEIEESRRRIAELRTREDKNFAEADYFTKQGNKVLREIENLKLQGKLTEAQIDQARENINLIVANIDKINDEAALLRDELKGRLSPERRKEVQDALNNIEILYKATHALNDMNLSEKERLVKLLCRPLDMYLGFQGSAANAIGKVL